MQVTLQEQPSASALSFQRTESLRGPQRAVVCWRTDSGGEREQRKGLDYPTKAPTATEERRVLSDNAGSSGLFYGGCS